MVGSVFRYFGIY